MTPKGFLILVGIVIAVLVVYVTTGWVLDGQESRRTGTSCNKACVEQGYDKGHVGVDPFLTSYCLCQNREKYLTPGPNDAWK